MKATIFSLILVLSHFTLKSQTQTNERAQWFIDARFGMFIHWGLYSAAEGYWKGEKIRNNNDYAEWILYRNRIEKEEYLGLLKRFDWDAINPEEWVILAKKSGIKYVTLTAKHHDGFALWDSKVGTYDLGDHTQPRRDIVKELADACHNHGLKMGLYYSHWVDWEHKYGWDHTREVYGISNEEYDVYWQQKVMPQMRELLTNYGDIGLIWFDMWIDHSESIISKKQLLQLKSLIRELQPNCLVNSRIGLSVEEEPDIDFKTLGDNQLGTKKENFPWQSPATVAHSWGFHATDSEWKSTSTLLKSLIGNVSLNGNFMLNIGPRANGDVPFEIEQRMLDMGKWLKVNGESIYGAQAFDLHKDLHNWGKITCKSTPNSFKLFLHLYNYPLNKTLPLTGISSAPQKIYLLADKQQSPLEYTYKGPFTKIALPALQPDPYITVVVLEYDKKPAVTDGLVAQTTDNGYALTPRNLSAPKTGLELTPKSKGGTLPEYLLINSEKTLKWKFYVDQPGKKMVDISYSFQNDEPNESTLSVEVAGQTLKHTVAPSGKTVGEPNQNWVIDNFGSNRLGEINFTEPGIYEIELKLIPTPESEVKFQWLWIADAL